jgi:cytochrome c biogenesis protein
MKTEDDAPRASNRIWRFFISIRLTVAVLLTLAATSIIGTLIPQNANPQDYVRAYGEFLYRVFYVLDVFDMYHSWWFQLLLVLLTANIVACSIDRLSSLWKTVFVKTPAFRLSAFRSLRNKETFTVKGAPDHLTDHLPNNLRDGYAAAASRSFAYTRTEKTDAGFCIFAEKGRWTRLGVYIVHLSVVFLLIGGLIGSIFGFDGFVNIPEGESVQTVHLRKGGRDRPLDFAIRCDDFQVSFYKTGAPKEYRSSLAILEDGKEVLKKDIIVNDPLRYSGINIFQSSYGKMPADLRAAAEKGIALSLTSNASGMVYTEKAFLGKPLTLPEGGGTFTAREMLPSYLFMGQRDLGETLVGELVSPEGEKTEVKLPVRFSRFDKMRKGARFVITVTETMDERYYTGLQVTNDPGVPMVYAGFILMILGCIVTFFMSHQRLCIDVAGKGARTTVTVSGTSNKNRAGMEEVVRKVSRQLNELGGGR